MPSISVIVPVYNTPEELLKNCVNSILKQTYQDFEVIMIDDGSTDKLAKLMDSFGEADRRIKVFHQENQGLFYSLNRGIERASGQYIMFVDSDDLIFPYVFDTALKAIENTQSEATLGLVKNIKDWKVAEHIIEKVDTASAYKVKTVETKEEFKKLISQILTLDNYWFSYEDGYLSSGVVSKLFLRERIKNIKFEEDVKVGGDTMWLLKVFSSMKKICVIDSLYYFYIENIESITHKYRKERINEFEKEIGIYEKIIKSLWKDNLSDLYIRLFIPLRSVFKQYIYHESNPMTFPERFNAYKQIMEMDLMREMIINVNFMSRKKNLKNFIKQVLVKINMISKRAAFLGYALVFKFRGI